MKNLLLFVFALVVASFAQQPQTSDVANTQPLFSVNAKYVNGVAPGYWLTAGSGLTLNVSNGTVWCLGTVRTYSAGTLTMTNSTTNYVYLDSGSSCSPSVSTSSFAGDTTKVPLGIVVTAGGVITSITDDRPLLAAITAGGSSISGATANGAMYATGSNSGTSTGAMSDGQLLIGDSTGAPQAAAITAGANVTITPGHHSITIAASSGGGVLPASFENDTGTGTTVNRIAEYVGTTVGTAHVKTLSTTDAGIGRMAPIVGICTSGCGTSGQAVIQSAGTALCDFDSTVSTMTAGDLVYASTTTAGKCTDRITGDSGPNENPEGNVVIGKVHASCSSCGSTTQNVDLTPIPPMCCVNGANGIAYFLTQAYGSPFAIAAPQFLDTQSPASAMNAAFVANIVRLMNGSSTAFTDILANSGAGSSGRDPALDILSHCYGSPCTQMFRLVGSHYNVPYVATVSGTASIGQSGHFRVGTTGGVFILTLSADATTYAPENDNAGHLLTFEINPSGHTWTWPAGFVGAPTVTGSTLSVSSYLYDGTNWNCIAGCGGGTPGGGTVTEAHILGTTNQVTVSGTCDITSSGTCTLSLPPVIDLGTDNSVAGGVQVANGSANAHTTWGSAATTSNTVNGPATAPTDQHLLKCATTGTVCTLADGGAPYSLPTQYAKLRCESGLGDGLNAVTAGTYLQSFCYNDSGVTWTITGIKCFTDNSGTSTLNAAGNTLGALLTGAVTCSSAFAAGTQSANVALTSGDYIKFTFVADGTSKQTTWVVSMTQ